MKKILLGILLLSTLALAKPIKTVDDGMLYSLSIAMGQTDVLTNDGIKGQALGSKSIGNSPITTDLAIQSLNLMCKQQNQKLIDVKTYDNGEVRGVTMFNQRMNGYIGYMFYDIDTKKHSMESYVFIDLNSK